MRLHIVCRFAFALVIGAPALGYAQADTSETASDSSSSESDSASKIERAQKAFDKGTTLYLEREFAAAIVQFRKAYNLVENPVFLYNIAMAQMQLGNHREVLETTADVREREDLGEEVESKTEGLARGSHSVIRATSIAETIQGARAKERMAPTREATSPDDQTTAGAESKATAPGFGALGWVGLSTATLGGAAVAGASVMSANISRDIRELRELRKQPGAEASYHAKREAISSRQTVGRAILFSGAGLAVTGVTLTLLELFGGRSSEPDSTTVSIAAPGRVQLTISW